MQEVRNSDGRLVCCLDEAASTIEIKHKNCITRITLNADGTVKIVNIKDAA
ncbi:MAG: hypothetical protein PHV32_09630 [Eubacteriales bacterium]|jgi:hypothetical protein|nr:hypothetical protein [Eubacteriales bacterium]